MRVRRGLKFIFFIPVVLGFMALGGWIVMILWNLVIPDVFPMLPPIDFWHALGLLVLSKILFGHFGKRGGGFGRHHRHKSHLRHKWMNMTDEEKEKFKAEWKEKCKLRGKD